MIYFRDWTTLGSGNILCSSKSFELVVTLLFRSTARLLLKLFFFFLLLACFTETGSSICLPAFCNAQYIIHTHLFVLTRVWVHTWVHTDTETHIPSCGLHPYSSSQEVIAVKLKNSMMLGVGKTLHVLRSPG